ncbi:MAG: tRNA epoxyqueuosine(34) reductase QueG [Acidobacteria bacterium]|nr:tRNA epoxyqueuosine(34) reductase QueG [Acidobacteriota bacterium]
MLLHSDRGVKTTVGGQDIIYVTVMQSIESTTRGLERFIKDAAARHGFDLCGIAPAVVPDEHRDRYLWWLEHGFHGEMTYMERQQRQDIRLLFPEVRSVICAAMVYNSPYPKSTESPDPNRGWISRYSWGGDYHDIMRDRLEQLLSELRAEIGVPFDARICVDTAPLLERTIARAAGLGWIAKNTCLINQEIGSWFIVGEILTSLELEPDAPPPDGCGSCTRCIDACPTAALVSPGVLDATRCIAYFTIEARGPAPEEFRPAMGRHVFGCDICQDVCPWNRKAPVTELLEFHPRTFNQIHDQSRDREGAGGETNQSPDRTGGDPSVAASPISVFNPPLDWLASLTEDEFKTHFRRSPIKRAKYRGMLRNVATAMGNSGDQRYLPALEKLLDFPDPAVQEHARWAIARLRAEPSTIIK